MGGLSSCMRPRASSPTEGHDLRIRPQPQGRPSPTTPGQGTGTHQAASSDFSAMLQSQQSRPSSPAPAGAAPGNGPTAPASPAHSSGQASGVPSAGPSAPQRPPIDAVHFRNSPFGGQNQNPTTQYIRDLDAASPSFHNTVSTATNNGRNSLDLNYAMMGTGHRGEYDAQNHRITVDPVHPQNADVGGMQGVAAFEMHNAANRQSILDMGSRRDDGSYEQRANQRNVENPGAPPVTGARLYAQDQEHHEWQKAKQAHQAMTEGAQQGLQAPPVFSNKFEAPAGGQAPWANFQGYQKDQWKSGHTQQYMNNYQDRRTELGQGGPPASSPSLSFGEPGPGA